MQDRILTVPNVLSFIRLLAVPVLGWRVAEGDTLGAGLLIIAMGWTDFFDGLIARRFNQRSKLGTILDPVADRFAIVVLSGALVVSGALPLGFAVVVIARDVILALAYIWLAKLGWGLPQVNIIGKRATFALLTALPCLVLGGVPPDENAFHPIGIVTFAMGALLYWAAFGVYVQDARRFLTSRRG